MELLQNSGFVALAIFIINVIFNFGFYKARLSQFPSKEEVLELMKTQAKDFEDDIDKKLEGHCVFGEDILGIKKKIIEYDHWIREHEKWAALSNEANHLLLQEVALNTRRICDKIGIKYLKQNGNGG
jgi:DNA replication protein DnaD